MNDRQWEHPEQLKAFRAFYGWAAHLLLLLCVQIGIAVWAGVFFHWFAGIIIFVLPWLIIDATRRATYEITIAGFLEIQKEESTRTRARRTPGLRRGQIQVRDDFDAPLGEDGLE